MLKFLNFTTVSNMGTLTAEISEIDYTVVIPGLQSHGCVLWNGAVMLLFTIQKSF